MLVRGACREAVMQSLQDTHPPVFVAAAHGPRGASSLSCGKGQVCPKPGEHGVERERRRSKEEICPVERQTEGRADVGIQSAVEQVPRLERQDCPDRAHCVETKRNGGGGRATTGLYPVFSSLCENQSLRDQNALHTAVVEDFDPRKVHVPHIC